MAKYYIAGLLKHAPAMLAFSAPTTNSYKRLVPGFEAPVNLVYSARNRSRRRQDPDILRESQGQAPRVPSTGLHLQPLPVLLRHVDGRSGRNQEQSGSR